MTRLPDPLPIPVRARTGEPLTAYLHRLAVANHLNPSHLRTVVNDPQRLNGHFRLDRLAALAGRTPEALRRTLTVTPGTSAADHGRPRFPRLPRPPAPAGPGRRNTADKRCADDLRKAAAEQRRLDRLARNGAIVRNAAVVGMTRSRLAALHDVSEDTVSGVLHGRLGHSGGGDGRTAKISPTLEPVKTLIGQMRAQDMSIGQIWIELVDRHHSDISWRSVKNYVNGRAPRR